MGARITLDVADLEQVMAIAEANGWSVVSSRAEGAKVSKKPTETLTVSEAAAYLNAHPDTIRRWVNEGKLASFRTPGGHRRIPKSALQENAPQKYARVAAADEVAATA